MSNRENTTHTTGFEAPFSLVDMDTMTDEDWAEADAHAARVLARMADFEDSNGVFIPSDGLPPF